MSSAGGGSTPPRLASAFDELRFGRERTLNLRASLPTPEDACARAEAWLRERQVARAGEVLIITGRGASSPGGISPVREAVARLLARLRRAGVVRAVHEHTAGSFVVELSPVRALRDAPPRLRDTRVRPPAPLPDPAELNGLSSATRDLLRRLARLSLEEVGARDLDRFVPAEMLVQFARLLPHAGGPDPEARLQRAIQAAIAEYEDG